MALYYLDLPDGMMIGLLLFFSIIKFTLVVLYFMHLKFDARVVCDLLERHIMRLGIGSRAGSDGTRRR